VPEILDSYAFEAQKDIKLPEGLAPSDLPTDSSNKTLEIRPEPFELKPTIEPSVERPSSI
jgi:hypothetical protein